MKYRKGFVTNSSSSSFILSIILETESGDEICFNANGGTPECGRTDYFEGDAIVTVSPKQLGKAKDIEELIVLLTEGVVDSWDWADEQVKIFEKSNPQTVDIYDFEDETSEGCCTFDAYDFIKEIREKVKSMNDISKITISGEELNYRTYRQEYTYDKKADKYIGEVYGCEFEKDGASGGSIEINDIDECNITYEEDTEWD